MLRVWILGVALGSFAAGMVVGFALPELLAADGPGETPEQQYARNLIERYGLSAAQERSLRLVMQRDRERKLEIFDTADWSQLPAKLRNEHLAARRSTEQRIRALLDERQREQYDRDNNR